MVSGNDLSGFFQVNIRCGSLGSSSMGLKEGQCALGGSKDWN